MEEYNSINEQTVFRCAHCRALQLPKHLQLPGCRKCSARKFVLATSVGFLEWVWAKLNGYRFTSEQWSRKRPDHA
jgi:hypothetical protein